MWLQLSWIMYWILLEETKVQCFHCFYSLHPLHQAQEGVPFTWDACTPWVKQDTVLYIKLLVTEVCTFLYIPFFFFFFAKNREVLVTVVSKQTIKKHEPCNLSHASFTLQRSSFSWTPRCGKSCFNKKGRWTNGFPESHMCKHWTDEKCVQLLKY